jgi:hypothetical protein
LHAEALVLHDGDRDHGQQEQDHEPAWQRDSSSPQATGSMSAAMGAARAVYAGGVRGRCTRA